jgi:hypothetical protein
MKKILKKQLEREVSNLLKLHTEHDAYEEFIKYLDSTPELKEQFNAIEINEIFSKPISIESSLEVEVNEEGDVTTSSEYTDFDSYSLQDLKEFGWLNDDLLRQSIISDAFYKKVVFPSIGDMPMDVKNEIQLHSSHILGRCNNPNNWGENIQGLVYGMVQSGKTASMMTLMGQAKAAGYRIFIVLSGDKESLRNQTQKRINEAFDLVPGGYSKNTINKIRSLTELRSDYNKVSQGIDNGLDLWLPTDTNQTIIICIKKQKDNLEKLLKHLKDIQSQCTPGGRAYNLNFDTDFKTLILDDEADFASQDTTTGAGTRIHNLLCDIRGILKQNCYVAYTATPQACIGANPGKLIGYPKDFIWLLDPHRQKNGETSTYLGLEEFFEKFPNQLIERLNDNAWPHVKKEEGVRQGIYMPDSTELRNDKRLTELETEHVKELIKNKNKRDNNCQEFKLAIVDYLIGCSIRWHRHFIKCKNEGFFISNKPTLKEIEEIEANNSKLTIAGYKPFPYHAMMFNLAYINDSQGSIIILINLLWKEIKDEWIKTKKENWKNDNIFTNVLEKQIEKSTRFESTVPGPEELETFIESAIKISEKTIYNNDKYIYLLNSRDEGSVLQYDSLSPEIRPKKAAIIVGGNILSRGLTIENLSVTVFARSQVMSLGDTNLQMCRWFGHKKGNIDLQTVYMQSHSQELFQSISEADKELRSQFKYHIYNKIPNKCLLLALFNSPLFQSTSPSKMRNSGRGEQSYSGITVDLLQHIQKDTFLDNNQILEEYLNKLKKTNPGTIAFDRATVYQNVPNDEFISFFGKLKFADDALNISPKKYLEYIDKWNAMGHVPLPTFNIAIFDAYKDGSLRKRARKIQGVTGDFKNEDEYKKAALKSLAPFRGGKSDPNSLKKKYCGDYLIDFPESFHEANYYTKNLRREKGHPILFMFYKVSANYVGRFSPSKGIPKIDVHFKKGDDLYIQVDEKTPLITFSIATPLGGPVFETRINNAVVEIVKANSVECEKFIEKLNSKN